MICIINNDKIMLVCMSLSILCGYGVNYCYNKVKYNYYNKTINTNSDIENQKYNILTKDTNKLL